MAVKMFSILLSAMVLFQSLGLHSPDVFEMDVLLKHLSLHEKDFGDDLFSFLDKHYGLQKKEHDKEGHDGDRHEPLPFQHEICKISSSTPVIIPNVIMIEDVLLLPSEEKPHFSNSQYSFLKQFDIFQPPRLA